MTLVSGLRELLTRGQPAALDPASAAQVRVWLAPAGAWQDLVAGPPTPPAQRRVLAALWSAAEPVRVAHRLPEAEVTPGTRLRRLWGRCDHFADGRRPRILVRCTRPPSAGAAGAAVCWRSPEAIAGTLLHEMAHLRYRSHGPRFWALARHLLDGAAAAGVCSFDVEALDLDEWGRGAEKLSGTAAHALARAAADRRRERAAERRAAARMWQPGDVGVLDAPRGIPGAGQALRVLAVGRSWLSVSAADGRRYRVLALALRRVAVDG